MEARTTAEGEVIEMVPMRAAAIVKPAVTAEEAIEAWREYQHLKSKITTPDDVQNIQGRDFLKKSFWRKCATFFNLSVEKIEEHRIQEGDGSLTYEVTYKATAPNGRYSMGDGASNTMEKPKRDGSPNSIHNTRSTAHTRAFNRSISNLVGGGEVSAEEADQEESSYSSGSIVGEQQQRKAEPKWGLSPDHIAASTYVMAIPKNRNFGKTLDEMGHSQVQNDYWYWSQRIAKEKKPATGEVKKFLDQAERWLKTAQQLEAPNGSKNRSGQNNWTDPSEPPPHSDEDIQY